MEKMVQFDVKRVQKGVQSFMVSFDFTKTPITQIADYIIIAASKHGSSDIHFDPRENGMMVRFRIDGDCQDYTFIPLAYEKNLATRLKLLANMNITESRLPQDGAIKGDFGGTYLDMRVSSLPLNEGEKIVIRILDYTRSLQGIDTLGFHPDNLQKVKRMMGIPNGIILTTGATGSGKSTTTYSILQGLNKPETNVITVEDPIEMNIEGINQVQVNAEIGMTFAAALRSILRQDPNVILIGEIRDSETAQIAVRASITGHLVLSTIHTNNALATVERLLDMNVERYLLSTALTGIISQRLAKMLCPDCRYQRETTKYEKKVFKKYMHMDVPMVWDANPKGCDHCRKGYKGRIAVHEVLELDDEIRNALNNEKLEKKELAKLVYGNKTITMLQDALIKCLDGKTSFEEVYRTIEIENEDDDNYEEEVKIVEENAPEPEPEEPESDDLLDGSAKGNEIKLNVGVIPINEGPEGEEQGEAQPEQQPAQAGQPQPAEAAPTEQPQPQPEPQQPAPAETVAIPTVQAPEAQPEQAPQPEVQAEAPQPQTETVAIPTVQAPEAQPEQAPQPVAQPAAPVVQPTPVAEPTQTTERPQAIATPVDQLAPEEQMQPQNIAQTTPTTAVEPPQVVVVPPQITPQQAPQPEQPTEAPTQETAQPQAGPITISPNAVAEQTSNVQQVQPTNTVQSVVPAITEVNPAPATEAAQITNPATIVPEVQTPAIQAIPEQPVAEAPVDKPPEIKTFDIKKPEDLPKEALLTPIPNITTNADGSIESKGAEVQAPLQPRFDKLEKL